MSTECSSLLQETKMHVRCTLVSNPGNMTVQKLNQDYKDLIGEPVPYTRLGYKSLIEFLEHIPDVVEVNGKDPLFATLTPVITSTLSYLNSFVMKQRVTKTKRGPVVRRRTVMAPTAVSRPTGSVSGPMNNNKTLSRNTHSRSTSRSSRKAISPKCNNRSTVTCERFTHSSSNTFKNRQSSSLCKERTHGNENRPTSCKEKNSYYNKSAVKNNVNKIYEKENSRLDNYNEMSSTLNEIQINQQPVKKLTCPKSNTQSTYVKNNSSYSKEISTTVNVNQKQYFNESTCANNVSRNYEKQPYLSNKCYNYNEIGQTNYLKDESPHSKGYSTTTNVKETERPNDEKSKTPAFERPDLSHHINNKIQANLKALIKTCPNGIRMLDLAHQYEQFCGNALKFEDLGFVNAMQFCLQIPHIFNIRGRVGAFMLFDAAQKLTSKKTEDCKKFINVQKPNKVFAPNTDKKFIPNHEIPNVVSPLDVIGNAWSTANFEEGKILEIIITEAYDPTRFWFTIYDKEHFGEVHSLMDDMWYFYGESETKYTLPKDRIENNMICAAYFNNYWRRILIIQPHGQDKVKAFFIDYGATDIVDISCIRFLSETHKRFPAQAIKGGLDFIIPANNKKSWPIQVTREFIHTIRGKVLTVYITRLDEKNNIVRMAAQVNDGKVMTQNEELVRKGHAEFCLWNISNNPPPTLKSEEKDRSHLFHTSLDEDCKCQYESSLDNNFDTDVCDINSDD